MLQKGIKLWKHRYKEYEIGLFKDALAFYELPPVDGLSLAVLSAAQQNLLLYGCDSVQFTGLHPSKPAPKTSMFESVSTMLLRRLSEHKGLSKDIKGPVPLATVMDTRLTGS
ncbi:MAG: hypothetical protein JEY71_00535 [Sphaerochaeta sp.]|nr:hypothetical protein [Sphaerochaeta sp.]